MVHEVAGDCIGGEASQPMRHPVHPPPGLVRVQDRRVPDLGDQGFIPEEKNTAQCVTLRIISPFDQGKHR